MPDIKQKFIGTWKLESIIVKDGNNILYPFGKELKGILFYSENYMSVQIMMLMKHNILPEQITINHGLLAQTLKSAGYLGYFGTYKINEDKEMIIHNVEGSIAQRVTGWEQSRKYKFEDGKLILSSGNMGLTWVREE